MFYILCIFILINDSNSSAVYVIYLYNNLYNLYNPIFIWGNIKDNKVLNTFLIIEPFKSQ